MGILRKILKDFRKGENITLITTILLVVVTIVIQRFGLASSSLVSSITLALLALLATGFLVIRYRIEEIIEHQSQALDQVNVIHLLDRFPLLLDEYLESADEILMLGLILRSTTYNYYDEFKSRVKKGLKIKSMITNPYSSHIDIDQITERFSRGETSNLFKAAYETVLEQYKRIREASIKTDNVQVRLLDFVPPFSLYIFPNEKEGGVVFVQIYAYKAPEGSTPRFMISEQENPIWYRRFCRLYEKMWEDATDYFPKLR